MSFLVDDRRVKAAATSMHQFCPVVRSLFSGPVDDDVVECATVFMYFRVSQEVFGRRFARRLGCWLKERLRHSTPEEVEEKVERIARQAFDFEQRTDLLLPASSQESRYEHHVRSVIRALVEAAGFDADDPELVREMFVPYETVLKQVREHLNGIKHQNHFLL